MVVLRVERKENIQVKRTKYIENHHLEMKRLSWQFLTLLRLCSIKILVKDKSQQDVIVILKSKLSELSNKTYPK